MTRVACDSLLVDPIMFKGGNKNRKMPYLGMLLSRSKNLVIPDGFPHLDNLEPVVSKSHAFVEGPTGDISRTAFAEL